MISLVTAITFGTAVAQYVPAKHNTDEACNAWIAEKNSKIEEIIKNDNTLTDFQKSVRFTCSGLWSYPLIKG